MIVSDDQYQQSLTVLQRLQTALASLRSRVEPINAELFKAMAQTYIDEITEIRNEIDEYIGVNIATDAKAPLWFSLEGQTLNSNEVSTRLLTNWLSKFRIAIQNVAEYIETQQTISGRPSAEILEKTDPKLVMIRSGSIKIGIKFPQSYSQGELFKDNASFSDSLPHKAVDRLLQLVAWADSDQNVLPDNKFPDNTETTILVNQIISLVPSRRSIVKTLRFSGALVPHAHNVFINLDLRPKLQRVLDELTIINEDTVIGVIREIDLDAQRIILRERGPEAPDLKCYLPDNLVSIAEELLDKTVRVHGRISSSSPDVVEVLSIEEINVT